MEKQSNALLKSGGFLLAGIVIGYLLTTFVFNSSCPKARNLRLAQKDISTLTVSWDAPTSGALYYTVVVRDSLLPDSIYSLEAVNGNTATLKNLKPGTKYFVDVYTVCQLTYNADKTVKADISVAPITISATTDYIIIAEVIPTLKNCPFGECNTQVPAPGNSFNWSTGEVFYKIEIQNSSTGAIVATNYLDKFNATSGALSIKYAKKGPCSDTPISPMPAEPCTPFFSNLCGSFTDGSVTINYRINLSNAGCQVQVQSPYTIRVTSCGTSTVNRPSGPPN
ncbi:MAG: fibronectin type III domain-containing protein [Bacteroidota bacterium]|uniref:fibronectin type III domain-containing protein n=1 Tax=Runella sp. TaxID=1960881 RepID=UPI003017FB3B